MPEILSVIGTATSAGGTYFSYQASKIEPVEVTTLSKECVLGLDYVQIGCDSRKGMTQAEKRSIATNNRKLVEICGIARPEILTCP